MEINILGPVGLRLDGRAIDIRTTKVRGLLGILAYGVNQQIHADKITEQLWDDDPPPDPGKTLQTYMSRLRRTLKGLPVNVPPPEHRFYRLTAEPSTVDYHRFLALVRAGRAAAHNSDPIAAAESLSTAVSLWTRPLLADLPTDWARRLRDALVSRDLLPAYSALFDTKLKLGDTEFVLARLPTLMANHEHNEQFAEQWIRALAAAGRRVEIPSFYREFTERLAADDKGGPNPELAATYQRAIHRPAIPLIAPDVGIPTPPRDTPYFTGRDELLVELDALLTGQHTAGTVVALDGPPGVGKSGLATHWAHRHRKQFPDGVLHIDLQGYAVAAPVEPAAAMATLLNALGVSDQQIPPTIAERAALLRHVVAQRQLLIILDNARDSTHVRPLLAATAPCPTLVTSRNRLSRLTYHDGAVSITVPPLPPHDATVLLARRTGATEPDALENLADLCGRLPLALLIVGEHVARRPAVPIADLTEELRRTRRLLDAGAHGDDHTTTLRSTFSWSHHALPAEPARLLSLLGLHPGTRFSAHAAAALSGLPRLAVDDALDTLLGAHLVEQERVDRYRLHDITHLYVIDHVHHHEPPHQQVTATTRLVDWYLETARQARTHLTADPQEIPPVDPSPSTEALIHDTADQALRWFSTETSNLLAITRVAADQCFHERVWRLAACLNDVLSRFGDLNEVLEVHNLGRTAAAHLGRVHAEAGCTNNIGLIYLRLDDRLRAGHYFELAYQGFRQAGDTLGEAISMHNIAIVHQELGNPAEAITWHHRALEIVTRLNNEWAIANVHRRLGDAFRKLGQPDNASASYNLSLSTSQKIGDLRAQGRVLTNLARLHLDEDDLDNALINGRHALELYPRTLDKGTTAEALLVLAAAQLQLKSYPDAITHATQAVQLHRGMRNLSGEAHALDVIGNVLNAIGNHDEANKLRSQAADIIGTLNASRSDHQCRRTGH